MICFSQTERPKNVPEKAFWVGGVDGGKWYIIEKMDESKGEIHFKIFNDQSGSLIADKVFKLHCNNVTTVHFNDIKNLINAFDGERILLTTTTQDNKYCYFK